MGKYWDIFVNGYMGYADYLWKDIMNPSWSSSTYWLLIVSAVFFILEVVLPWRKGQATLRKDFFLDAFYIIFNFFLFSLIIYKGASDVIVTLFNDSIVSIFSIDLQAINPLNDLPYWAILTIVFIARDFVQWWIHRLLHRIPFLWEFHKVHHSVEEMGFAAHLRFHWMESIIYNTIQYIPLALLGIGLHDFFIVYIFTLTWGHFNHSNITLKGWMTGGIVGLLIGIIFANGLLDITFLQSENIITQISILAASTVGGAFILGPIMRKLFNSPEMHIWHHAYELPEDRQTGVNFGLTLAIWDYIFGTAYIPHDGRDIRLGFPGIEEFPEDFIHQSTHGFTKE